VSDDPLLRALGRLAREQDAAPVEPDALRPIDDERRARIAAAIVVAPPAKPRFRLLAGGGVVVAALAAAALLLLVPRQSLVLPAYESSFDGGEQTTRGEPQREATPKIAKTGTLTWVARPAVDVHTPLVARVFVVRGAEVKAIDAPIAISPDGAARLAGKRDELLRGVPAGPCELVMVVGTERAVPRDARGLEALSASTSGEVKILRKPVILLTD
jgi:hypothetical protein